MDNSDKTTALKELSTYQAVINHFIEEVVKENLDVKRAYGLLGSTLMSMELIPRDTVSGTTPRSSTPNTTAVAGVQPEKIQLTKVQVEEAKKKALATKAKKLKLSVKEVNLTSQEVKAAKAEMRRLIAGQSNELSKAHVEKSSKEKLSSSQEHTNSRPGRSNAIDLGADMGPSNSFVQVLQDQKKMPLALPERTGEKKTHWTKIQECKRKLKQSVPVKGAKDFGIHLVAYSNHWKILTRQWEAYKSKYSDWENRAIPYGKLPNPTQGALASAIAEIASAARLGTHSQYETYVLQDTEGGSTSYWDKDQPSQYAPKALRERIPDDVMEPFLSFKKKE